MLYLQNQILFWHENLLRQTETLIKELRRRQINPMKCYEYLIRPWPTHSIHGHISYILEASSIRPNDFSLIGTKPNKIWQFAWKKLTVLKFKLKLNSKFMLKRSKTIKITKRSKNRRGLTQVKAVFFAYKKTRNIDIL